MDTRRRPLLHRRALLAGLGAASLPPPHLAVAAPGYGFKVGDFEITVISDGYLTVPIRFLCPQRYGSRNQSVNCCHRRHGDPALQRHAGANPHGDDPY
jgi:hypothetical protein